MNMRLILNWLIYAAQAGGNHTNRVHGKILDRIGNFSAQRIFYIDRVADDRFLIVEACDEYYRQQLSADELRALGQELIDAATSHKGSQ